MKLKFLLSLLVLFVLMTMSVESRTALTNCVSPCSDSDGCTCPSHCVVTGNIDQNANCGGDITSCAQENRIYWVRDEDCQSTCGDFDNEFMIGKGWEKVDYNCYLTEEPKVEEEKEGEKIEGAVTQEPQDQEIWEVPSWVVPAVIVVVILLVLWFVFRRKIKKLF